MNPTAAREIVTMASLACATAMLAIAAVAGWPVEGAGTWALAALAALATLNVAMLGIQRRRNARALTDALGVLRGAATHDPLTRLWNRVGIVDEIRRRLSDSPFDRIGVISLDLDRLASVNHMLGHDRGDTLLIEMADRIADTVGTRGSVGRLGADHFAIVLDDATDEGLVETSESLLRIVNRPVRLGGIDVAVTATIGTATTDDVAGPEDLIRASGLALEQAKLTARNRVMAYEPAMSTAAVERLQLIEELRAARNAGEFEVYFQPIVSLTNGRIVGAEALLRWNHPSRGIVDAELWVGIAVDMGLLASIGQATLSECCRHFAAVNAGRAKEPLSIAVNLSAPELLAPELVGHVRGALASSGLDPHLLILEVNEEAVATPATSDVVRRLRQLGVRIAIDDFGTGYSSLDDLRSVGVDQIKIDRAFVDDLGVDEVDTVIVQAVIDLANGLGLEVVAEGVTSEDQVERLRTMGGMLGQGFLYGRALPFTRFMASVDRIDEAGDLVEGGELAEPPSFEAAAAALTADEAPHA